MYSQKFYIISGDLTNTFFYLFQVHIQIILDKVSEKLYYITVYYIFYIIFNVFNSNYYYDENQ